MCRERELRKKERMEKEMKELKETLEHRAKEIKARQNMVAQGEDQIARLEQMLKDQRATTDKVQKEYNLLNEKSVKLQHDLEEQIHTNTQLLAENSQKQILLKLKEDEINQIKVILQFSPLRPVVPLRRERVVGGC
jgi:chromosome segregation ATPase